MARRWKKTRVDPGSEVLASLRHVKGRRYCEAYIRPRGAEYLAQVWVGRAGKGDTPNVVAAQKATTRTSARRIGRQMLVACERQLKRS